MDPLSIAASVAGSLGLAIEITKILRGYAKDVKSAPEEVHNILQEVTVLSEVLGKFAKLVETDTDWHLDSMNTKSA
jgi:hypothetical protein